MTIKLYDENAYLKECTATVTGCEKCKEGYKIYLDQTIFFARGGGQLADKGEIQGLELLDAVEEKNGFVHLLKEPLEIGKSVACKLDFDFRFDQMQQHMGQHIFSRIAENTFGAKTVSARIDELDSHVELSKKLSHQELFTLQNLVNDTIKKDLPIYTHMYNQDEARSLGLPEKAFTHDIIRVVEIKDLDFNPCGGTHPHSTAEVEKCVITGTKEVRGVFRVYYKFGTRAKHNSFELLDDLLTIQEHLDIQDKKELLPAISDLEDKISKFKAEIAQLKDELCNSECDNLLNSAMEKEDYKLIICNFTEKNHIKSAIDKIILENNCAVFVTNIQNDSLNIILSQTKNLNKYNMGALVREILAKYNGKGGGGNAVAQCTIAYSEESLTFVKELFSNI